MVLVTFVWKVVTGRCARSQSFMRVSARVWSVVQGFFSGSVSTRCQWLRGPQEVRGPNGRQLLGLGSVVVRHCVCARLSVGQLLLREAAVLVCQWFQCPLVARGNVQFLGRPPTVATKNVSAGGSGHPPSRPRVLFKGKGPSAVRFRRGISSCAAPQGTRDEQRSGAPEFF